MPEFAVKRDIHADQGKIWGLLTDAAAYPSWNPAVIGIEGDIAEGSRIKLTSIVNPSRQFKLEVVEYEPPTRMVWADGMPLGLFRGARTFEVVPKGDGSCEFSMVERYTGLMAPLITKSIPDMSHSFEQFADGLKRAAEQV